MKITPKDKKKRKIRVCEEPTSNAEMPHKEEK